MDRGAWWATVLRVARSWTWLKQLGTSHFTREPQFLEQLSPKIGNPERHTLFHLSPLQELDLEF